MFLLLISTSGLSSALKTPWLKMTGCCTGDPSSVHNLPRVSIVVASSLSLFFCYPCIKRASYINNAEEPRPFLPFSALQFLVCCGLKMWSVWIPKSHSNFTRSGFFYPIACEQALHLRAIVKSRRAWDKCVARLASLAQIAELARRLFFRRMVIQGFAALQIQKFFAYKDSSGELEQPCRVYSFYTGFLPFSA